MTTSPRVIYFHLPLFSKWAAKRDAMLRRIRLIICTVPGKRAHCCPCSRGRVMGGVGGKTKVEISLD